MIYLISYTVVVEVFRSFLSGVEYIGSIKLEVLKEPTLQ